MKKKIPLIILITTVLILALGAAGGYLWMRKNEAGIPVSADPSQEQTTPTEPPLLRDLPGHTPTVVLDAGHGFRDPGCAGPETALGAYEYELTMEMVNTLKTKLESQGIRVLLTHNGKDFPSTAELVALCDQYDVEYDATKDTWADNDTFSPYERVIYMNALDAQYGVNFALSVHVNANVDSEDLNGFDLDYCAQNPWSQESKIYAETLKSALHKNYPGRNLWYYEDSWEESFIVTKYNSMPSALLETGYYTNAADAALLRDKNWRDGLMQTVSDAICEVLK